MVTFMEGEVGGTLNKLTNHRMRTEARMKHSNEVRKSADQFFR